MACALATLSCASASPKPPQAVAIEPGPRVDFEFESIEGKRVSSQDLQGRNTIVVVGATWDVPSQAQANFLKRIVHNHVPRTNALLVFVQDDDTRVLVEAFASAIGIRFPVVQVSRATVSRSGLKDARTVPEIWVLDKQGRLVWRHKGVRDDKVLTSVLRSVEATP